MSETFLRNLNFQTHNLGREATLLLTFDGDMKGIYKEFCPIVWKSCAFGKEGPYSLRATYLHQLAFFKAQVDEGTITDAATCVKINKGQLTKLTQDDEEVFHFSEPEDGEKGFLQAKNETGLIQDIGIGFMCPGDLMPTPLLYFNGVGDGSCAVAKFIPKIRAYITSDYEQTAILQHAIDGHCIWEQDLSCLDSEDTTWKLTYDEYYGYRITRG